MRPSRYNVWVELGEQEYVYNGVTGALLRAPAGTQADVARFDQGALSLQTTHHLLEQMVLGRILVPDAFDEIEMLRGRYERARGDASVLGLTIVPSLGCNFDCPYCFEDKHPSLMSAAVQDAVVALVEDRLPHVGALSVTWFGGEPLVGKRALFDLSERLIELCDRAGVGYEAAIITNGYLLDEETCRRLAEQRVRWAQITVDGPAETHDRMRPLVGGKPSFERIVTNLRHVVDHLAVSLRFSADRTTMPRAEELLRRLADEGLAGRLTVHAGHLVGGQEGTTAPAAGFGATCLSVAEFAAAALELDALAARYGFGAPSVPTPTGTPCTAVRPHDLVIGSDGELYKCWESVGNPRDVVGSVLDASALDSRSRRWIAYDPFTDAECTACIALPVCMGGCAQHALDLLQHDNRCGPFRHNYHERVATFVEYAEQQASTCTAVPVQLTSR